MNDDLTIETHIENRGQDVILTGLTIGGPRPGALVTFDYDDDTVTVNVRIAGFPVDMTDDIVELLRMAFGAPRADR